MPKIVFIEPQAPNLHIFSQFPLPRLGTLILGTMMKKRGWDVELFVEDFRTHRFRGRSAAPTSSASRPSPRRRPGPTPSPTGSGRWAFPSSWAGPHVTFLADEALEHADFVIRGEGGAALAAFIDAWESGAGFGRFPIFPSGRRPGRRPQSRWRPRAATSIAIPFPDFSLLKPDAEAPEVRVVHPRPDLARLSLRLLVLLRDRHVRQEIPVPLDGEHHRGAPRLRRAGSRSSSSTTTTSPPTRSAPGSCCEAMIREDSSSSGRPRSGPTSPAIPISSG